MSSSTHPAILKARQQAKAQSQKMSITQTFYLAHQARGKLSSEAAKHDHELRYLVGHANLLDRLMLHLSQAEQEQDAWFNNMVSGNSMEDDEVEHKMQSWETIPEEEEETWLAQDYSDSDSESDDEEYAMEEDFSLFPALTTTQSQKAETRSYHDTVIDVDEVDSEEEDEDENGFYTLERTTSHRPPSLVSDESDDDEEDSTPPSPPQPTLAAPVLSEKQRKALVTTSYYDEPSSEQLVEESFYLSSRSNAISAY